MDSLRSLEQEMVKTEGAEANSGFSKVKLREMSLWLLQA